MRNKPTMKRVTKGKEIVTGWGADAFIVAEPVDVATISTDFLHEGVREDFLLHPADWEIVSAFAEEIRGSHQLDPLTMKEDWEGIYEGW